MSDNAFKNLINPSVVKKTSQVFHEIYPLFNRKRFEKISPHLSELELKQRVLLVTKALRDELPQDYLADKKILEKVLAKGRLAGFELWPISEYISQYGTEDFDASMDLMYQLTQHFTSEFAIRPFLKLNPQKTLRKLKSWVNDESVHVRRWISEGTRPLLPWGGHIQSFIAQPETLHLLEELKYDEELYVRKSVANHLNDIAKHHPELVIKVLGDWVKAAPEIHLNKIQWIKKHALRTLIKKGNKNALALMGVNQDSQFKVGGLKLNQKNFELGDTLEFEFWVESGSKKSERLIVDYVIGFMKSNGEVGFKVFKLKSCEMDSGGKIHFLKAHQLKKITTMKFYPGRHQLSIQVNGKILKSTSWTFDP
jgi:3-methyladenine DNA glycosylase AlkC